MKSKKQLLLGKIEATYGVDPVLVGATDAMLAGNITISPLEMSAVERVAMRGFLGAAGRVIAGEHVKFGFEVEMFASGTAGTAPAYALAMKACAHSETVVALTSVTYAPVDTLEQSATFYFNRDGKRRVITGWRGSVKAKLSAKGIPMWSFDGIGLYALATDVALPVPTLTSWRAPLLVEAGVTTASLHGYSGLVSEFELDGGAAVVYRNLINGESVQFTGRTATASLTLEEPTMAQKDFESIIRAGTLGALAVTHGTVAGNKVVFNAASAQLTGYAESEQDGIAMIKLELELVPATANTDYSIVYN